MEIQNGRFNTSPSQRQEDFKKQSLTCSMCNKIYDDTEHQAKFLPCLHSYCKSCLQQHADDSQFSCPNCGTLVTLTNGTINSLPNNFIVENLQEHQDIFDAVSCGSCDEGSRAIGYCHDCECFLCKGCVDNHDKMRPLRRHKLSTVDEIQEDKCNPMMQRRCKVHPAKILDLYCKETDCKIQVCVSCGLDDHRGHDIVDLTVAVDEIVSDMRQSSATIATRNQELNMKHAAVDTMQKTLTDNFNKIEKAMRESVQKLYNLIDTRYNKARSHLKRLYQTEKNRLTESNESIDFLATQMTSASEFANKACDMSHPMQLLNSHIMTRLHELENAELPATESDTTDFVFTAEHHSAIAQIGDSLQHLCDVAWFVQPQTNHRDEVNNRPIIESKSTQPPRGIELYIDPGKCTIQRGQRRGQVQWHGATVQQWHATVQTVNFNGQLITSGGVMVEATQGGRVLEVMDNKDGTYTILYYDLFGGSIQVNINGTSIKGSPFNI